MRISKVPVDMASEQKELLGVVSKRELGYLIVGGLLLHTYLPIVYGFFSPFGWMLAAVLSLISAMPVVAIVVFFGFTKVEKYHMNRDYYYWIKMQRKTQYGSWRKGR